MIEKVSSLQGAEKVLNLVMSDDRAKGIDAYVTCYQNCREQGYCINSYDKVPKILICRYRTSDKLCVYNGADSSSIPTNRAFNEAKFFGSEDYQQCADYVLNLLEGKKDRQ